MAYEAQLAADFPEYDHLTLPAIPAGWEYVSRAVEQTCVPYFHAGGTVGVLIDYSEEPREMAEDARFHAVTLIAGEIHVDSRSIYCGDDWSELLSAVNDAC